MSTEKRTTCTDGRPCQRHAALGYAQGLCGALTRVDLTMLCEMAEDARTTTASRETVDALANALVSACEQLAATMDAEPTSVPDHVLAASSGGML